MWFKRKKFVSGVLGKEPKDPRNYQLCEIQPETVALPDEFDLRDKMSPIGHQNYGSCVSWGTTSVKEYLDSKEYGKTINLSEKFVYHTMKQISGLWTTQGDYVKNGLAAICKYGAPLIGDYPDDPEKDWETYVKKEPPLEIYQKAEQYKGKTYWVVGDTLEDFRQAIFQQNAPVVFSMMWFESYRKPALDGKLSLPDKSLGGHCVSAIGWTKEKLWFRNSHSLNWGFKGYAYIPFQEFTKHDIWNCWILLDLEKTENLTGWLAEEYIASLKFSPNEMVESITDGLRIRELPNTNSAVLGQLLKGERCVIMEDENNGITSNNHRWWKVTKVAN